MPGGRGLAQHGRCLKECYHSFERWRYCISMLWIKSNTLPFDDADPIFFFFFFFFFRGVVYFSLGPVRVENGQYVNLQWLDSFIQGSLGEQGG